MKKEKVKVDEPVNQFQDKEKGIAKEGQNPSQPGSSNFKIRTITTLIMLGGFFLVIAMGHLYCCILILFINGLMFKEILDLKRNREREQKMNIPLFRVINWHFFGVAIFYCYPRLLGDRLLPVHNIPLLEFILHYHSLISFGLYIIGFMLFVFSLEKGQYKYQFQIFGWTHLILLFIVCSSITYAGNIINGLIWFIFPALLIIANDIFAYLFGIRFGRTPLIDLSPKKTWEGFIGGWISTMVFAFIFGSLMSKVDALICPAEEFTFIPFVFSSCQTPSVFLPVSYEMPWIFNYVGLSSISLSQFQIHSCVFVMFASFIAPFGGFFASGFKRAFRIKDFGDTIPGHGGLTDRFDCQLLMGVFVYVWSSQVVFPSSLSVGSVMNLISNMSIEDQLQIYEGLKSVFKPREQIAPNLDS